MKKHFLFHFVFFLLFVLSGRCFANTYKETVGYLPFSGSDKDSVSEKKPLGIIKINPIQTLFSEIPISFELFLPKERSLQFQVGFIFPSPRKSMARKLFETSGENGEVSSSGLVSYRKSPYNNYGLSFKFEFRKYGRYYYHGPQLMYKNCFYKNSEFSIYEGYQTESKFSNIFGFGYILGRQNDKWNLVFDWYGSAGFRVRAMEIFVSETRQGFHILHPNSTKSITTFYPFVNLGLRIGIKLWSTNQT